MALLEAKNLTKTYRLRSLRTPVLESVAFSVESAEMVSIIGPSGSGKTTLLNLLGGLDREYDGSLRIEGHEMRDMTDRQISLLRNRTIGFIFQSFHLLDHLTCMENVKMPFFFSGHGHHEAERLARAALERVGVGDKADIRPTYISGGQKQRVAIARALVLEPKLLLCDEPTGNLDRATGDQIIDLFRRLNEELRVTVVVVTHDEKISRTAPRVLRLEDRRIEDRLWASEERTGSKPPAAEVSP
jgi:ABC-type lipoprotein export system ATPase subunit